MNNPCLSPRNKTRSKFREKKEKRKRLKKTNHGVIPAEVVDVLKIMFPNFVVDLLIGYASPIIEKKVLISPTSRILIITSGIFLDFAPRQWDDARVLRIKGFSIQSFVTGNVEIFYRIGSCK